jgi:predicted transcriptional regulator
LKSTHTTLSRRERQIMDVLYAKGRATATEIMEGIPDSPSNSTVRTLLRVLEQKGHVRHEMEGTKFIFIPTLHPDKAKESAIRHLIRTFFEGSPARAVAALLDVSGPSLSDEEAARLKQLIEKSRGAGKK